MKEYVRKRAKRMGFDSKVGNHILFDQKTVFLSFIPALSAT